MGKYSKNQYANNAVQPSQLFSKFAALKHTYEQYKDH